MAKRQQTELDPENDLELPDDGAGALEEDDEPEEGGLQIANFAPAPEPEPAPRPAFIKKRGPGRPKKQAQTQTATLPNGAEVTIKQPKAQTQTVSEPSRRPSLLKRLGGGRMTGYLTVTRVTTKGQQVAKDNTGMLIGRFQDTPDLPSIIQNTYGGGRYTVSGEDDHGDTVTEDLDLPGESLPLVDENNQNDRSALLDMMRGAPEPEVDVEREQQWWIWDNRRREYRWTKPGVLTPNVPMPNQGLPPGASSAQGNSNDDWYGMTPDRGASALEAEREARRKAEEDARLLAIQTKHEKEMAELKSMLARISEQPKEDPMKHYMQIMQAQNERAEADRRALAEAEVRRHDREEALRREDRQAKEAAEDRRLEREETARKEAWEKREAERREERERDDRKREDDKAREERLFQLMLNTSKKDGMSQIKEVFAMANMAKDLLGGEKGPENEKLEMLRVGGEVLTQNLIPAVADLFMAWKGSRPEPSPEELAAQQQAQQNMQQQQAQIRQIPMNGQQQRVVAQNQEQQEQEEQPQGAPPVAGDLSTEQWATVIDWTVQAYKAGNSPVASNVAFTGFCQGRGINIHAAKAKIGTHDADKLISMLKGIAPMVPKGHPLKGLLLAADEALSPPEGRAWWNEFADRFCGRPVAPKAAPAAEKPPEVTT